MKHKTYKSWFSERVEGVDYLGTDLGQGAWDYLERENQKLKESNEALRESRKKAKINECHCESKAKISLEMMKENQKLRALLDLAMGTIEFYGDGGAWEYRDTDGAIVLSDVSSWIDKEDGESYEVGGKRARTTRQQILEQLGEI
jgi:hypothetical protein